jgi:hypothetical protein
MIFPKIYSEKNWNLLNVALIKDNISKEKKTQFIFFY